MKRSAREWTPLALQLPDRVVELVENCKRKLFKW
jgi:hypothetical protein